MATSINPYGSPKSLTNDVCETLLKLINLNHWTFRPRQFVRALRLLLCKSSWSHKEHYFISTAPNQHLVVFVSFLRGGRCVKTHKCPLYGVGVEGRDVVQGPRRYLHYRIRKPGYRSCNSIGYISRRKQGPVP